ncbi:Hypothetical protein CINCED_3A000155 [Cinara cedri]|uniref:Uncharacterized protein n=1 Tax=Cinara cedri TaxID=506608 RepID=A0A5E4M4L3_9HEMI|nr:Hypothetical protein CINCED_3A000155 [Cinara cedri]
MHYDVTYSNLMEIATNKEAAMNDKSGWRKEDDTHLKYHRKTSGYGQFKRILKVSKESKAKCGVCGYSNHIQNTVKKTAEGTEYSLSKIEHFYTNISGSKYFSKINLKDVYQQIVIKESDRKYTNINNINTHKGLFSYTRNSFGIKWSAGEFQKAGLKGTGVFQYDKVADSTIAEHHNARLNKLLNVL